MDEYGEIGISSLLLFSVTIAISGLTTSIMLASTDIITNDIEDTLTDVLVSIESPIELLSGYAVTDLHNVTGIIIKFSVDTPIDSQLVVEVFDGAIDSNLTIPLSFIRNIDPTNDTYIEPGDIVSITLDLCSTNQSLTPGASLEIIIYPITYRPVGFVYTAPEALTKHLIPLVV